MPTRLEQLLAFLAENPSDDFLLFAVAKEHEKAGDDAAALDFFKKLEAAHPAYVGLFYHLGKLYERLKRPGDAVLTYKKGIETARAARDFHAASELQGALLNLGFEEDDDEDF